MDVILHGGNQTESAKRLKTTQSTVARRLAASNYITYKDLEGIINRYLKLDTGPKMYVTIRRSIMTGVRANSFLRLVAASTNVENRLQKGKESDIYVRCIHLQGE